MTNFKKNGEVYIYILLAVCLIIALITLFDGCIQGYCPNYIPSDGLIYGFHSSAYECKTKQCYRIYADILWDNGKTCVSQLSGKFTTNTTDLYEINDQVEIYVNKNNQNKCVLKDNSDMETNAIASIVFFIFTCLICLHLCCKKREDGEPQIIFLKV